MKTLGVTTTNKPSVQAPCLHHHSIIPQQKRAAAPRKCSRQRLRELICAASNRSRPEGGLDPSLEVAVPPDQRPVNELASLRDAPLYSWALLKSSAYVQRLTVVWLAFFFLLGIPIASQSFDPYQNTAQFVLSGATGALAVVAVAVIRIYLGWSYVGNRLLSAAVDYEESGWYDGQVFVKPPEVLARDRLLGTYEVKPTLERLKTTLLATGGGLLLSGVLLVASITATKDDLYSKAAAIPRAVSKEGLIYSAKVRSLADLKNDDEAAAAEAEAQRGVPGYCGDRFFKAFAGGQYCSKIESNRAPPGRR
ncbi:hypothetical protein WJX73_006093 [Symbiochloris irregularis]|uniref:Uncharacterized protein n=1 Tax=Symbiochloris irregularis TaxID=706552 RepID=A0AAW1PQQ8_9CHLO